MQVYISVVEWNRFCNGERVQGINAAALKLTLKLNNKDFKLINVCMDEIITNNDDWVTIEKHY
jgi:hypothetical protein